MSNQQRVCAEEGRAIDVEETTEGISSDATLEAADDNDELKKLTDFVLTIMD
jgi:hypothetical protein